MAKGDVLDKLQGHLRSIRRARLDVNAARAEFSGAVTIASRKVLQKQDVSLCRQTFDPVQSVKSKPARTKLARGRLKKVEEEVLVNTFITLDSETAPLEDRRITDRRGRLCTATVRLSDLEEIARPESVLSVELADTVKAPTPALGDGAVAEEGRPRPDLGDARLVEKHGYGRGQSGKPVLVGIIDVGGFDFAHPDFLDPAGESRFVRIWDQGGDVHAPPEGYAYGAEFLQEHLNLALRQAPKVGLPATELEPQSQRERSSHATHVASIAAGNGGICRNAMIAGVLISLPPEDQDRRLSFYDTTRIAHAVDYLFDVGEQVDAGAVVINISLGTNGGAHDDSAAVTRWIDSSLATPGRAVCVAAGNAGQEAPLHPQDLGFLMGRIHTSGRIPATNLERDLHWIVVGDGVEDISENELEIWYGAQDRFAVQLRTPGGEWLGPVKPGEFIENLMLSDRTFVSIYNERYDVANGDNKVSLYLSPFMSRDGVAGITPGRWVVRLIGQEVRDGSFHGWIERDDPMPVGRLEGRAYWRFPSFFAEGSNVDSNSISSLACGPRIIGVANLDEKTNRINVTSSQGPTRDRRFKPDGAAPGTDILAANGFVPDVPWIRMTGTSMASPYVAGVVGLMLAIRPSLTAAQIGGIIQRTARPLPGATYAWQNDAGFGVIDPAACLKEAAEAGTMKRLNPRG